MVDTFGAIRSQLDRQVTHWSVAASRLVLDDLAAPEAWGRLEQYLGLALRKHLSGVVGRIQAEAAALVALPRAARTFSDLADVHRHVLAFRHRFVRAETTLDYFSDAINTRTNPKTAALLRACDTLAHRSMAQLLEPLGHTVPPALTFLDKGLGASILKAGLRLWDGGAVCPVAAIKVTRHNILRPTALIHEAGHQVAHIIGWTPELAIGLQRGLASAPAGAAEAWASWASEIAADAFAFVHTGFASVAALHDVVASESAHTFRHTPGDPHPISFLRVLMGVEMCRHVYGPGPWDELAHAWTAIYDVRRAPEDTRDLLEASVPRLRAVAEVVLDSSMKAFGGRSLRAHVVPERVSPTALEELYTRVGAALFTSSHWLWSEPLRVLALTGYRIGSAGESRRSVFLDLQEQSMLRIGGALQAA